MTTSHRSHGFQAEVPANVPGNIARTSSAGKAVHTVETHPGMTSRQRADVAMGHANETAPVESGGVATSNPLAKPPVGDFKSGKAVPIHPSSRHRDMDSPHGSPEDVQHGHRASVAMNENGRNVLSEAVKSGGKC